VDGVQTVSADALVLAEAAIAAAVSVAPGTFFMAAANVSAAIWMGAISLLRLKPQFFRRRL
jgi:hypothetical protein